MDYGKYIIIEAYGHLEAAICFDIVLGHDEIARGLKVISAGQFVVRAKSTQDDKQDIEVSVFGESTTLKKESRKEDAALIKRVLRKYEF